jgi:hypothetical protein
MHPNFAPCILMCRLCEARILQGSTWIFSSTAAHVAWWLGLANTTTYSYDLPRSNMAQQHPGAGGYKVEPGVPPNAGDHESVSLHTVSISPCALPSFPSGRNCIRACRMAAWSVLSRTRSCGDFHRFQNSQCSFDPRVCRVVSLAAIIGRAAMLLSAKRGLSDLGGSFHSEPEPIYIKPSSLSLV